MKSPFIRIWWNHFAQKYLINLPLLKLRWFSKNLKLNLSPHQKKKKKLSIYLWHPKWWANSRLYMIFSHFWSERCLEMTDVIWSSCCGFRWVRISGGPLQLLLAVQKGQNSNNAEWPRVKKKCKFLFTFPLRSRTFRHQ